MSSSRRIVAWGSDWAMPRWGRSKNFFQGWIFSTGARCGSLAGAVAGLGDCDDGMALSLSWDILYRLGYVDVGRGRYVRGSLAVPLLQRSFRRG